MREYARFASGLLCVAHPATMPDEEVREHREERIGKAYGVQDQEEDHREAANHREQDLDLEEGGRRVLDPAAFGQESPDAHRQHVQTDGHAESEYGVAQERRQGLPEQQLVYDAAEAQEKREDVDHRGVNRGLHVSFSGVETGS